MSAQPPPFENIDKCRKCGTGFSLFTRKVSRIRSDCRNCGRTFCGNCSTGNIPLPHFGISENVRVCGECEKDIRTGGTGPRQSKPAASAPAQSQRRQEQKEEHVISAPPPTKKVKNCTCNSPLCICVPDPEEKPVETKSSTSSSAPRKSPSAVTTATSSSTSSAPAPFLGFGGASKPTTVWNLKGDLNEQIREAVKAQDIEGVKTLLKAGADAKFVDRTGNSLAHLAAMFNRYDIIEVLAKSGADLWVRNPSKETPVDLAPPALQRKMKELQPQPQ